MDKIKAVYHIQIEGRVQGVGFRPFVYSLATAMNLTGYVLNNHQGVFIYLSCAEEDLQTFLSEVQKKKPQQSIVSKISVIPVVMHPQAELTQFEIRKSEREQGSIKSHNLVFPDLATCSKCLEEVMSSHNRRYQYLFTNCTQCGPRHTIIEEAPYDRERTTMKKFKMCRECEEEYHDPAHRRFHAEPNACPCCGPQLSLQRVLRDNSVETLSEGFKSLEACVELLKCGSIVAVKGLGGYHLVADAQNEEAVRLLRERKKRPTKPFALMMPKGDLLSHYCETSARELELLESAAAPIVLLKRKKQIQHSIPSLAPSLAPNNPYLGVMLPYTPLHHWLMKLFKTPLVMTSANISDEPLTFQEPEVYQRLSGIADYYLTHNRPITRPIDDSVVQVVENHLMVLRLARGLAPASFEIKKTFKTQQTFSEVELEPLFATGGHMKNTFAVAFQRNIILSQHLGDLDSELSQSNFQTETMRALKYFRLTPSHFIHDQHPSYFTSEWVRALCYSEKNEVMAIPHHEAHIYSALAENEIQGSFLGVAWDGTGYGSDGNIWGGEFFLNSDSSFDSKSSCTLQFERVGHLRPFILLGGESSIREPWRVALSLLFEIDNDTEINRDDGREEESYSYRWFVQALGEERLHEFHLLKQQWLQRINCFTTTSMGRLFEGLSALMNLQLKNTFEAEAAMKLEGAALEADDEIDKIDQEQNSNDLEKGFWSQKSKSHYEWDWRPLVHEILKRKAETPAFRSRIIHECLAKSIFDLAQILKQDQLVLGGGVFQNRYFLKLILKNKLKVILPSLVPLNDGGIAMGQIMARLYRGPKNVFSDTR